MKKKISIGLVLACLVVLPFALGLSKPLRNLQTSFVTCDTTPVLVQPATGFITSRARSILAINSSATPVFLGASNVDGSTNGRRGTSVCSSGCDWTTKWAPDVQEMYCYAGSSTVLHLVWGD